MSENPSELEPFEAVHDRERVVIKLRAAKPSPGWFVTCHHEEAVRTRSHTVGHLDREGDGFILMDSQTPDPKGSDWKKLIMSAL